MVVRVAVTTGRRARKHCWSLLRAAMLLANISVLPTTTQSAGLSPIESPKPASPFAFGAPMPHTRVFDPVFDPASAQFFSLLSYGAMSVIAPTTYGDFVSPIGLPDPSLSSAFGSNGIWSMPETQGIDPAVTTILDGTLQQGLLPPGPSSGTEELGVASGAGVVRSSATVPTISTMGLVPQPACGDNQLARRLQAGGESWEPQAVSATPALFPPGVFTAIAVENPLGLGPRGSRSNLSPPGPAGAWCRPAADPSSQNSPLDSPALWIGVGILLVGIVVFWLSRGFKMPTRGGPFVVQARSGTWASGLLCL